MVKCKFSLKLISLSILKVNQNRLLTYLLPFHHLPNKYKLANSKTRPLQHATVLAVAEHVMLLTF